MALINAEIPAKAQRLIAKAIDDLRDNPFAEALLGPDKNVRDSDIAFDLSAALPVYTLELKHVCDRDLNQAVASGWCYIVQLDGRPIAAAEASCGTKGGPPKYSNLVTGDFVNEAVRAMTVAKQYEAVKKADYEVRRLKIPELMIDTLWLHGKGRDYIIVIGPTFERLERRKIYTPSEFFRKLATDARRQLKQVTVNKASKHRLI